MRLHKNKKGRIITFEYLIILILLILISIQVVSLSKQYHKKVANFITLPRTEYLPTSLTPITFDSTNLQAQSQKEFVFFPNYYNNCAAAKIRSEIECISDSSKLATSNENSQSEGDMIMSDQKVEKDTSKYFKAIIPKNKLMPDTTYNCKINFIHQNETSCNAEATFTINSK